METFGCALLGDSGVGMTSLAVALCNEGPLPNPLPESPYTAFVLLDGKPYQVLLVLLLLLVFVVVIVPHHLRWV